MVGQGDVARTNGAIGKKTRLRSLWKTGEWGPKKDKRNFSTLNETSKEGKTAMKKKEVNLPNLASNSPRKKNKRHPGNCGVFHNKERSSPETKERGAKGEKSPGGGTRIGGRGGNDNPEKPEGGDEATYIKSERPWGKKKRPVQPQKRDGEMGLGGVKKKKTKPRTSSNSRNSNWQMARMSDWEKRGGWRKERSPGKWQKERKNPRKKRPGRTAATRRRGRWRSRRK